MRRFRGFRIYRNRVAETRSFASDVILYDGECGLCVWSMSALRARLLNKPVRFVSFLEPGALKPFPDLTIEFCKGALTLVRADGRIFRGSEAVAQALRHRWFGSLAKLYYLPGARWLTDRVYEWIARNRYAWGNRHKQ